MCESLRKLVKVETFNILQDKLEDWLDNFKFNTCDQNVARGCEIIELNAKVQGQLFKLLSLCASEGGIYGGASVIKSRLLPILGQGFFSAGISSNSSLKVLEEASNNKKNLKDIKKKYEKSIDDFEIDLKMTRNENENLKIKLEEAKIELDRQGRQSTSEKMFDKQEIRELKNKLDSIKGENSHLKSKTLLTESYEHQLEHLKEDVAILSTHRSLHNLHSSRCHSPCDPCHTTCDPCHITCDPCHTTCDPCHVTCDPCHHSGCLLDCCNSHIDHCDPLCHTKQQNLVSKLNDLFSITRTDAMNTLSRYSNDHENNQKIIFHAVTESFNVTKSNFRTYKSKVRSDMIGRHSGCSLEESVQYFINNHADHELDLNHLCREVVRALEFKVPLIRRPSGLGFDIINSFIREVCRIAWNMASLPIPVDVYHPVSEGELFDETRYRRSYDSDYNAAFVLHHIWPCLIKNGSIVAKGEAITKRAGSRSKSPRRGRSPTASISRISGRSPSPVLRSSSPKSFRSKSPISKRRF